MNHHHLEDADEWLDFRLNLPGKKLGAHVKISRKALTEHFDAKPEESLVQIYVRHQEAIDAKALQKLRAGNQVLSARLVLRAADFD